MKTNKQINNKTSASNQENNSNSKGLRSRSEQVGNVKKEEKPQEPVAAPVNTQEAPKAQPAWSGVFFNGPEPEQDREGENDAVRKHPVWTVYAGDADANPLSKVYRVFSFAKAENLAKAMANDRKLELIAEAQAA